MQVCVESVDGAPCATTDASGDWLIEGLPAGQTLTVVGSEDTYVPWVMKVKDVDAWPDYEFTLQFLDNTTARALSALVTNQPYDATKGAITINAYVLDNGFPADGYDHAVAHTPLAGATFTLSPESGVHSFLGSNGLPDNTMTQTGAAGIGFSVGVVPGEYAVTVAGPTGYTCNSDELPIDSNGAVAVTVRAGYMTGVWLRCVVAH